jgi:hypothetical protein
LYAVTDGFDGVNHPESASPRLMASDLGMTAVPWRARGQPTVLPAMRRRGGTATALPSIMHSQVGPISRITWTFSNRTDSHMPHHHAALGSEKKKSAGCAGR